MSFFKDGKAKAEEAIIAYQHNQKIYRVNLYLTTCVSTVNGKNIKLFYGKHFFYVASQMNKLGNFNQMNSIIKEKLSALLSDVGVDNQSVNKPGVGSSASGNDKPFDVATGIIAIRSATVYTTTVDDTMDSSVNKTVTNCQLDGSEICLVCDEQCKDDAILCDACNSLIHYRCENLSTDDLSQAQLNGSYYVCKLSRSAFYRQL